MTETTTHAAASELPEKTREFLRAYSERQQSQLLAIRTLHGQPPLEFAQFRMTKLVPLIGAVASDYVTNAIGAEDQRDLASLAYDLAEEVMVALDLVPEVIKEGGAE